MKLKRIADQVVVVFGASSGIGRETALRFARQGARVVAAARGMEGLESLVAEIRQAGGEAVVVSADAADHAQVESVATRAVSEYGGLDTWVHLAAVSVYSRFEDMTPEEFRQVVEVDLLGQVYGAMAALPRLRERGGGALVMVSSVEAQRAFPLQSAYAASKHGLHGLLEALRVELAHERAPISVTEVMPASVNTPFYDKSMTRLGVKPKPVPPVYPPEMVADAIMRAAESPAREIVVGAAAKPLLGLQRLSPRLLDGLIERFAFALQRTSEAKTVDAPSNLFQSLPGHDRVEGPFTGPAALTRAVNAPPGRLALAGAALGVAAVVAAQALRSRRP